MDITYLKKPGNREPKVAPNPIIPSISATRSLRDSTGLVLIP